MLEKIQNIFNRVTGQTDVIITPKTKLNRKAFNLSSFALIQLMCEIEDEFDVEIPNSEIKKMKTVKDVIDFLNKNTGN